MQNGSENVQNGPEKCRMVLKCAKGGELCTLVGSCALLVWKCALLMGYCALLEGNCAFLVGNYALLMGNRADWVLRGAWKIEEETLPNRKSCGRNR